MATIKTWSVLNCQHCYWSILIIGFQNVVFLLCQASFPPHFLTIVVEVKATGPPHVLELWLGVSEGMPSCKILLLLHGLFLCQVNFMEIIRQLLRLGKIWPPLVRDNAGFYAVLSVCYFYLSLQVVSNKWSVLHRTVSDDQY